MRKYVSPPKSLPKPLTTNPYWDLVRLIPGNDIEWEFHSRWEPDWTATLASGKPIDRHDLCREYSWSIPDPDSLQFVAQWLKPSAVEMGAGMGYWAWQLRQLGVDIVAYDIAPPDRIFTNEWHSPRSLKDNKHLNLPRTTYYEILEGTPEVLECYADRSLFLCWPPYDNDMATQCLNNYTGKRLVYIGESGGGCTANDEFFDILEKEWNEVTSHNIIQWWGINDYITVYERIKP